MFEHCKTDKCEDCKDKEKCCADAINDYYKGVNKEEK